MAANTYWIDNRLRSQRVASRTLSPTHPARDFSREIVGTRTEIRRRGGLLPPWAVFATVILATFALCITVTMRTHAEMRLASQRHQNISTEVDALRNTNAALELEVRRLHSDPRVIESAARTRLNMVRANEIIVPIE